MFIAIVNTCSLYSLSLFVPMVSTIKSQDSRAIQTQKTKNVYMKKPYQHRCINYNHRAVVSLFGLHMHMDMLHK